MCSKINPIHFPHLPSYPDTPDVLYISPFLILLTDVTHCLNNGVYSEVVEDHLGLVEAVPLKNYTGRLKIWTKNC